MSKTRIKHLTEHLKCNEVKKGITKFFCDYVENGKIERALKGEITKIDSVHFLPHRSVIREYKEATKIGAVLYASCSSNGPLLNDCLYSDPNIFHLKFLIFC